MKAAGMIVCSLLLLAGCLPSEGGPHTYSMPAEWEPHDAVWVSFFGAPSDQVALQVAAAVARHTLVKCVVPRVGLDGTASHKLAYEVRARLTAMGADPDHVEIVQTDHPVQVRDAGPIFVRNDAGALRVVDFRWNDYGNPALLGRDTHEGAYPFDSLMAAGLGVPVLKSHVAMEGGALETNGAGTLLQVESVTMQRNPGMTRDAIEAELKRVLGQEKIIWLKEGPAEDPLGLALITEDYVGQGVGGHVDEFARFVDPHTILLAFPDSLEAAEDPVKRITYERMQVNYRILKDATDQDGQPFRIIKVPVPDVPYTSIVADSTWPHPGFQEILHRSDALRHGEPFNWVTTASYLNFFVTNGVVLIPQYWQPGMPPSVKEEDAYFRGLMERFYPDREIAGINPVALNDLAGGIHCWTQQQPRSRVAG